MVEKRKRPRVTTGKIVKVATGCGNMYVTIANDKDGVFEVFAALGKSGSCAKTITEGLSRQITLSLRCGVPVKEIVKQLKGLQCPAPVMFPKKDRVLSCPDAVAKVLEEHVLGVKTREVEPSKSGKEGLEERAPEVA